jgi:hypothetical protein
MFRTFLDEFSRFLFPSHLICFPETVLIFFFRGFLYMFPLPCRAGFVDVVLSEFGGAYFQQNRYTIQLKEEGMLRAYFLSFVSFVPFVPFVFAPSFSSSHPSPPSLFLGHDPFPSLPPFSYPSSLPFL